ncbi:FecR family protein [Exilibacterium tricleocarpae]|nr:FecR domain-containing protein [Exilibacterium tricleocarpae]
MEDSDSIEAIARGWVLYLHSGAVDPVRLVDFEAWVSADPAHAKAYRDYEQLMGDLTLVEALADIEIDAGADAGVDIGMDASTDINTAAPAVPPPAARRLRTPALAPVAALAAVLMVALLLTTQWPLEATPAFETRVAQTRDLQLPDGSTVVLGGRSKIETDFSETTRRVTLLEGEAFFDVVADPERPFLVVVGDRLVRVVGTKFDVRHGPQQVRVAVLEGVVEVLRPPTTKSATQPVEPVSAAQVLRAGEQVVALIGTAEQTRTAVEPDTAAAWRRGWLSYENASLAEIAADANRYNDRQIVFASSDLEHIRVTASFGADAVDRFIAGLTASQPIRADYSDDDRVVLHRVR